jgi:hypothetical protein
MANTTSTEKSSYEPLDKISDFDLENDSDDTLTSTGFSGKHRGGKGKRAKARQTQLLLTWMRWSVVVLLQTLIVWLLVKSGKRMDGRWTQADTETGGDVNGLYVPCKFALSDIAFTRILTMEQHHTTTSLSVSRNQNSYRI